MTIMAVVRAPVRARVPVGFVVVVVLVVGVLPAVVTVRGLVVEVELVDEELDDVVEGDVLDVVVVDSVLDVVVVDSVLEVVVVDSVLEVVVVDSVLDVVVDDSEVVVVGYSVVVVVEHIVVVVVELPSPPRMIKFPWDCGHVVVVVVDVLGGGPSPPCTMIRFPWAPAGAIPNTTSTAPSAMVTAPRERFRSGAPVVGSGRS